MKAFVFQKQSRFINIQGEYKPGMKLTRFTIPSSYVFKADLGLGPWKGAGYIWGITFFFARNSGSARWQRTYRGRSDRRTPLGFEIGWTRNGNKIPYVSH